MSNDTQHYTNLEIFHSLLPKLKAVSPYVTNWDELDKEENYDDYRYIIDAIAIAYRSGYVRGQKGRSFLIGEPKKTEPKCTERWVPVNGNNVKKGDSVRYIGKNGHKNSPEYYPAKDVVGKVIKVCSDLTCDIQWPKGSTSRNDRWYASWDNLEVLLCE